MAGKLDFGKIDNLDLFDTFDHCVLMTDINGMMVIAPEPRPRSITWIQARLWVGKSPMSNEYDHDSSTCIRSIRCGVR